MSLRLKAISAGCGLALAALSVTAAPAAAVPSSAAPPPAVPSAPAPSPAAVDPVVDGIARSLGVTPQQARTRLAHQADAHRVLAALPASLKDQLAGTWFDAAAGKLAVAVTDPAAADTARAAGAKPRLVTRDRAELRRLVEAVRGLAGRHVPGLSSFGVDDPANRVQVSVNRNVRSVATTRFLERVRALGNGVRVQYVDSSPVQQAGEVNPGDPWWPGGESNCSVGFAATMHRAASTSSRPATAPTTPTSRRTARARSATGWASRTSAAAAA